MSIQLISAFSGALHKDLSLHTCAASSRVGYETITYFLHEGITVFDWAEAMKITDDDKFGKSKFTWKIPERYLTPIPENQRERIRGVSPWKPSLLAHVLAQEVDQTKTFVWIDADAWVIRPLTGLEAGLFDVAVTMRRPHERGGSGWPDVYGYLNAGVVVFRPTPQAMKFLKMWQLEVDKTVSRSDQHALNNLVRKATDLRHYNRIFKLDDIRIKVVACEDFNNYYAPEMPLKSTCILHFKKDVRMREDISIWIEKTKPENLK